MLYRSLGGRNLDILFLVLGEFAIIWFMSIALGIVLLPFSASVVLNTGAGPSFDHAAILLPILVSMGSVSGALLPAALDRRGAAEIEALRGI